MKHNNPKSDALDGPTDHCGPAPLIRGADSAIVWFKQFNSVVSIPDGSDESVTFGLLLSVAELL